MGWLQDTAKKAGKYVQTKIKEPIAENVDARKIAAAGAAASPLLAVIPGVGTILSVAVGAASGIALTAQAAADQKTAAAKAKNQYNKEVAAQI